MSDAKSGRRSRTVTWEDPRTALAAGRGLSGLEYLRAMAEGRLPLPPIAALLGYRLETVEEGRAVFSVEPAECHYNPLGVVHGGLLATVLDSAMACAIHSRLPAGASSTTLELHVNYVRAVTLETPRLLCDGELLHLGGRVATALGRARDAAGTLYAHATTTCLLLRPEGGG